jgi:hypothetical protein
MSISLISRASSPEGPWDTKVLPGGTYKMGSGNPRPWVLHSSYPSQPLALDRLLPLFRASSVLGLVPGLGPH